MGTDRAGEAFFEVIGDSLLLLVCRWPTVPRFAYPVLFTFVAGGFDFGIPPDALI